MVSAGVSTVLFVSRNNDLAARLAEIVFLMEADRSELAWTAISRVVDLSSEATAAFKIESIDESLLSKFGINRDQLMIPEQMLGQDLEIAKLVVYLQPKGDSGKLEGLLSGARSRIDIWQMPAGDGDEALATISQSISNLAGKLIMQGGRRQPGGAEPQGGQVPEAPSKSNVRVCLESKGRKGKKVTVVSGLCLADSELQKLSTKLKQFCGVGGTVKDGNVELQGDQCDRVLSELSNLGYKAKRSGAPSKK